MPSYYYTKFQKNPCVGRNERCPLKAKTEPANILAFIAALKIICIAVVYSPEYLKKVTNNLINICSNAIISNTSNI